MRNQNTEMGKMARTRRLLGSAGALLALALLGALAARAAGWGGSVGAPASPNTAPSFVGANVLDTPTDTPAPPPTPTPSPTPTSAPVPTPTTPPTPRATPTPTPLPITFTCAEATTTDTSGYYRGTLCATAPAGATFTAQVGYSCVAGVTGDAISGRVDATGHWSMLRTWVFQTHCALPFTITLTAAGSDPQGDALAGSTSFVVSQ